jgi:aldose 1-epimerase
MEPDGISTLEAGDWSVHVDAGRGGLIRACRWRGHDIFAPAGPGIWPEKADAGCFPLVPFSNRIRGAEFSFLGERVRLPAPAFVMPHALHGLGWRRAWRPQPAGTHELALLQVNPGGAWPWPYEARQTLAATGNRLSLTLSLKNTGSRTMPAGIGLHPYFPRSPDLELSVEAEGCWQTNAGNPGIPTKWVAITPDTDVLRDKDPDAFPLDNCFTGWNGKMRLTYPATNLRIDLAASVVFSNLVVYRPAGGNILCLEPVSHVNDALSLTGLSAPQQMDTLQPGESLEGTLTIDAARAD